MKNIFNHIYISPMEYSYLIDLNPMDKLNYLFEIFEMEHRKQTGSKQFGSGDFFRDFFDALQEYQKRQQSENYNLRQPQKPIEPDDRERIDVQIDENHILIESNNLAAVRHIVNRFFDGGYILARNKKTEKMFRADKVTRYFRVYDIVGEHNVICPN